MVARPIITSLLLWSIGLGPFVAILDAGKEGAAALGLTFPRRELGGAEEWWVVGWLVGSQISNHRRLNSTLVVVASLSLAVVACLSLASSFYVYAPACCVVVSQRHLTRPIQCLSTQP